MAAVISQLPSLTHLLLLPSQQPDPAAAGPVAAALAAAAAVGGGLGPVQQGLRPRDWQLTEGAVRCVHAAAATARQYMHRMCGPAVPVLKLLSSLGLALASFLQDGPSVWQFQGI